MIWEEPVFKHRSLQEWIEGVPLPIGIEELVPEGQLKGITKKKLFSGALLIAEDAKRNDVVAGVLSALKDHAEEVACLAVSQVLRGLKRPQTWSGPDFATVLEQPDVLIILDTTGLRRDEEALIDRVLVARGMRPPRVTVLVGDAGAFTRVRKAYGEDRTYERRVKAPKKSSKR